MGEQTRIQRGDAEKRSEGENGKNCECCGGLSVELEEHARVFECYCMNELVCKACNHCIKHCKCEGVTEQDLPYFDQLIIARAEWLDMGVRI